jgi:cellulose synthase/poly-beta-1,6-N-acetylglucosamine synthase-like glycosyltransferase
MLTVSILVSSLIGIGALIQISATVRYIHWFRRETDAPVSETDLPNAAVIVSLRGADPYLGECLSRLTTQDYPSYSVIVVVGHPSDPARSVIDDWMNTHADRPISMTLLEERSDETYLKTSAIRQTIQTLDPSIDSVVIADADTIVYRRWLRDLTSPMVNSDVGVVTCNRWYDPNHHS